jgi:hypothetical protein
MSGAGTFEPEVELALAGVAARTPPATTANSAIPTNLALQPERCLFVEIDCVFI